MLGDKRFLRSIRLRNILSFGPDTPELELKSLNVLIGPNGSGKSNLIDAISLLQAAPTNLFDPIRYGGGIAEWLWKGVERAPSAEIEASLSVPQIDLPLRHTFQFSMIGQRAVLADEAIRDNVNQFYGNVDGYPILGVRFDDRSDRIPFTQEDLAPNQSVLSQRKDPISYPEVTFLGREYSKIRLFREWGLGRDTPPRKPQQTDLPGDFLQEDAANLAVVLNNMELRSNFTATLIEHLKEADGSIIGLSTAVIGGTIQLFLRYEGLKTPVPATRLSDGTIRYLHLLAVLCHPDPPPLVCLEEPELGLHPDLLHKLAELLIDASHRMQLIVTTHSDTLVDALTKVPEAIIVCEKENGSTKMTRQTREDLAIWLKEYSLGELWRRGQIGGNRW